MAADKKKSEEGGKAVKKSSAKKQTDKASAKPKPEKKSVKKSAPSEVSEDRSKIKEKVEEKEEVEAAVKEDAGLKPEEVKPPAEEKKAAEKPVKEAEEKKPEKKKKPGEVKEKPVEKVLYTAPEKPSPTVSALLDKRKKKPQFQRQELHKLKRLKDVWRKSRGIDSKKHEGKRGKGETPKDGYKNPENIRGIDPSGYYPRYVRNLKDLDEIDPKTEAAVLSASIGRRKRNQIISAANERRIIILNPRKKER